MTLNLTLLRPTYVLQVSDRRLTDVVSGAEFDRLGNKNVVYVARDGLFSICYSGPGFLEGVPTDTWIACKLADEDTAPFRSGRGLREGGAGVLMRGSPKKPWLDIGQSVELLRRDCETLNLASELTIGIAGWQKRKRGNRPTFWSIEAKGSTATADNPRPRYWHYERNPHGGRPFYLTAIPDWLSQSELNSLVILLMGEVRSAEAAVRRLIWAVRYVAARPTPEVGSHCMCILLPNPDVHRELFARYEPVTQARATITSGKDKVEVPAAFTPWYVGPQIHAPPRTIVGGGLRLMLGDIRVVELAPPVPRGKGILGGWFTQPRPIDPALGSS